MLVTYFINFMELNDHLFGKELFIRFSASAFRKLPSIYVFSYFPFGFEGRMWDLIVSVPDHCLSFLLCLNGNLILQSGILIKQRQCVLFQIRKLQQLVLVISRVINMLLERHIMMFLYGSSITFYELQDCQNITGFKCLCSRVYL